MKNNLSNEEKENARDLLLIIFGICLSYKNDEKKEKIDIVINYILYREWVKLFENETWRALLKVIIIHRETNPLVGRKFILLSEYFDEEINSILAELQKENEVEASFDNKYKQGSIVFFGEVPINRAFCFRDQYDKYGHFNDYCLRTGKNMAIIKIMKPGSAEYKEKPRINRNKKVVCLNKASASRF
jgi:hypothetical protein